MMSNVQTISAGVVLLTVIGIAYGGSFLFRVVNRTVPANELQRSYFRAGHAHAGVLVILGLVVTLLVAEAGVGGVCAGLSTGVLWAAILMPAGFSSVSSGGTPRSPTGSATSSTPAVSFSWSASPRPGSGSSAPVSADCPE